MQLTKQLELYLWAALAVVSIVAFSWYTHQQREIGRNEINAKNAELVEARKIHNAEVEARAGVLADEKLAEFKRNTAEPVANPHSVRVCDQPRKAPVRLPADAGASPRVDDPNRLSAALDSGTEAARVDIGGFTETLLRDATARVKLLQDYISICQAEGMCETAPK